MTTLSIVPNHCRNTNPLSSKDTGKSIRKMRNATDKFFTADRLMRFLPLVLMIFFFSVEAMAQTGASGFASATTTIKGYQAQVSNLMKAIGAVIAIVGAFNVYFKMTNGDQDVKKTIMLTIGGCIAFVALGEALPLFFE